MRKLILLTCVIVFSFAANYRSVPMQKATILQTGKAKKFCTVCGMTLPMFYKTNHAATIDGKTHQYCSIHCMHEEAMQKALHVKNPQVVDNNTLKFIKSEDAFYVVGSNKPATMSTISKYAFGTKKTADTFANKFGGVVMSYEEVAEQVQNALEKDMTMIHKRQAKAAKKGEQVYNKMCKKTDERFKTPALAKVYIKESMICGKLKGKAFQQVGLFLSR